MHYTMLFYQTEDEIAEREDPARKAAFWGSFVPYMNALREAGIVVGGAGLQSPSTATTVRMRNGERSVQDGPYADSKEQLGGFFILDVPNLETALEWAARYPARNGGVVEIRPNLPNGGAQPGHGNP